MSNPWLRTGLLLLAAVLLTTLGVYFFSRPQTESIATQTIYLDLGSGQMSGEPLGYGDTVELTLVNPTEQALIFETRYPLIYGRENRTWLVEPQSQEIVRFEYRQLFSDDLTYTVYSQKGQEVIAQGILVPAQQQTQQAAVKTTDEPAVETLSTDRALETPVSKPVEKPIAVRGYW